MHFARQIKSINISFYEDNLTDQDEYSIRKIKFAAIQSVDFL